MIDLHAREACHEVPGTSRLPGRTDLKVSAVGFGAWATGVPLWGPQDGTTRAWDSGLSLPETAAVYGDGHSESLIGRFMKETGHHPVIATEVPPTKYRWPA